MYDDNRKMKNTISIGSLFSIVIAFLGLIAISVMNRNGEVKKLLSVRSMELPLQKFFSFCQ